VKLPKAGERSGMFGVAFLGGRQPRDDAGRLRIEVKLFLVEWLAQLDLPIDVFVTFGNRERKYGGNDTENQGERMDCISDQLEIRRRALPLHKASPFRVDSAPARPIHRASGV